jgi:hypothetical protein
MNCTHEAGTRPLATSAIESNGQIGNLQLSSQEEADLDNFLKILNDGYTRYRTLSLCEISKLWRRTFWKPSMFGARNPDWRTK